MAEGLTGVSQESMGVDVLFIFYAMALSTDMVLRRYAKRYELNLIAYPRGGISRELRIPESRDQMKVSPADHPHTEFT